MSETKNKALYPPQSPVSTGFAGACPRCGNGRLFKGFLTVQTNCRSCGLDYAFADSGDGPAVFIICLVGFIVCGSALVTEVIYQPPFWVHFLIWIPLILFLSALFLRPLKGLMIALQYQNQAKEGILAKDEESGS